MFRWQLRKQKMAEADLDIVIRQLAKQQNKGLMTAVKRRRDRYVSLAAKAKDKDAKENIDRLRRTSCCKEPPPPSGCRFPPITPRTATPGRCETRQRPSLPKRRSRRQKPDPAIRVFA